MIYREELAWNETGRLLQNNLVIREYDPGRKWLASQTDQ